MSEHFEHNPGDHEDPMVGPTWLVSMLGVVLLLVIVLGLYAVYYNAQSVEDETKVIVRDPQELENLRAAQEARLRVPHQVRSEEEVATVIPIDHAMELIVQEYSAPRP